jgi:hypothetical protein
MANISSRRVASRHVASIHGQLLSFGDRVRLEQKKAKGDDIDMKTMLIKAIVTKYGAYHGRRL